MKKISSNKIKVVAIVGPTASGKTAYSIELAKKIGGEIISADSRLVYKGFNIGTAKPTKEEMDGIPHHMIDIVEPEITYSAGAYKEEAEKIIYEIHSRGNIPIVTGGTGLYIDILLKNYDLPKIEADYNFRNKLKELNNNELYELLLGKDSTGAQNIDKNDRPKIIRALEIIEKTGKKLNEARGKDTEKFEIEWIGRNFDRKTLYERINNRVDIMLESGLVEETMNLLREHGRIPNIINTIGYREITEYIDKKCTLEEAGNKLKQNTRNYAKRQLTWFRKNSEITWNVYPDKLKKIT